MTITFGLALMNDFPPGVAPADRVASLREQVRAARDSGISSIWVLQHYLGNMPTLQPIPLLAALSEDAGDLWLGTNMFILPLRHPVDVAEEFATLDHLSRGRVVAGFGLGYREPEFESFGIPLDQRLSRFEESLTLIRRLWSGEPATFHGRHYRVTDQRISLPPVQAGGPRIWIGAGPHRTGAQRAARLGDGWIVPPHVPPDRLAVLAAHYREERDRLVLGPGELVARRELLLDQDPERARALGLAARGALTRKYAAFNSPVASGDSYRHLSTAQAAEEIADASYLFTDPPGAVAALKRLADQGLNHVVLRAQWYDLAQDRVLRTLELFRDEVLPSFRS